jgi:phosphohistidine phosphatase
VKTVTLFRHAKSGDKDNPNIEDFDRSLSSRGLKSAPKMGTAMRERKLRPNLIISSPSARTRQTLSLAAAQAWDNPPKVRFDERLYEASAESMLKILNELPEDVSHVMIVSHNPGLQELAVELASPGSEERKQFEEKLPTAAVASFDFDADLWKELKPGTGHVRIFISPNVIEQGQDK